MDDLVERLRARGHPLANEAADEIVALRQRITQLQRELARDTTIGATEGGVRRTDPETSKKAARTINVTFLKYCALVALREANTPLNCSEMAAVLNRIEIYGKKWTRDTMTPRMPDLLTMGLVEKRGKRPGPTGRPQTAYVLTEKGKLRVAQEPPKPKKKKGPE